MIKNPPLNQTSRQPIYDGFDYQLQGFDCDYIVGYGADLHIVGLFVVAIPSNLRELLISPKGHLTRYLFIYFHPSMQVYVVGNDGADSINSCCLVV